MIELTHSEIDLSKVIGSISRPEAGGQAIFVGTTRQWTESHPDKRTDYLVYEAYEEMALQVMRRLAQDATQRWGLCAVSVVHRLGKVALQEASIVIAVSAPHRGPAFQAAQWLIDSIKKDAPIWKQEHYSDSTSDWQHPSGSLSEKQPSVS